MTQLSDDVRSMLSELAKVQEIVNRLPKSDIVDLDLTDFALVCRALKSQSYGSLGERWLCKRLGLTRVTGNKDYDAVTPQGNKIEIKFTLSGVGRQFSIVQIRPHADLDYYLIFGITSENKAHVWRLDKAEMRYECDLLKAGSAHGKLDPNNPVQELRLTLVEDSADYARWNRKYQILTQGRW